MTHSMKDLEARTDAAYHHVASLHVEIECTHSDIKGLRRTILTQTTLFLASMTILALIFSWLTILPAFAAMLYIAITLTRRLHYLNTMRAPRLTHEYRAALTEATDALQEQEDRRTLGLMEPEQYAKLEAAVEAEAQEKVDKAREKRKQQEEDDLWDAAFRSILLPSPYRWL